MLKDVRIFVSKNRIDYSYDLIDNYIVCNVLCRDYDTLAIYCDGNIFDNIIIDGNIQAIGCDDNEIKVDVINKEVFSFKINVNYKFFVKTVYKFINKFNDKDNLLEELNIFLNSPIGLEHKKELEDMIINIDKPLDELIFSSDDEIERIRSILLNSELYLDFAGKMSETDLMLMVTSYIFSPNVPRVDQEFFDEMFESAKKFGHANELIWRLAMNYDSIGYNFDKFDKYFVDKKDVWYLGEYIRGVNQDDYSHIISLVIDTDDKKFIEEVLNDDLINMTLEEEDLDLLRKSLENS